MNAIILAAGSGTRLHPLTMGKPKCMVRVNGTSIIESQIQALLDAGVGRVILATGFRAEQLVEFVESRFPGERRITFVENGEYASTNNMYSLSLCRDAAGADGFLLLNGDVVFDPSIVAGLLATDGSAVGVDVGRYEEESMKVLTGDGASVVRRISKAIPAGDALGCSIDLYRFDQRGAEALWRETERIIEGEGQRDQWTEVALDGLVRDGRLALEVFDIRGRKWWEIDDLEDLRQAELLFGRERIDTAKLRLAFVDMDGTLYRGNEAFPGIDDFIRELRRKVSWVYFLSNNSSRSRNDYQTKLAGLGIDVTEREILLSTDALCAVLKRKGVRSAHVVGTQTLVEALRAEGIETVEVPEAVVVGFDTELTYEKLRTACLLLRDPAVAYLATHADRVCPTEAGDIPDAGSIIALIETATGRLPQVTCGKPNPERVAHVFARHGVDGSQSVFFGDRVYTDYEMARNCGALFVGVLSGEATRDDYEHCHNIVIMPGVRDVFAAVQAAETGSSA